MSNKFTLITGASSGMGALCAKQFSTDSKLILAGSNQERLEKVKAECNNKENIILWVCDFATERDVICSNLLNLIVSHNIVIDKFIHFAGVTKMTPIKTCSIANVDTIFNVNLFSAIEIIKSLLKKKNQNALENIILISALYSERGNAGNSIYAASKGALNSLVYSLAREIAPVRINALLPGAIETPMTANLDENYINEMTRDTPLGWGKPEDVVNYAEFLFSEKSKWVTGQAICIDGGRNTK